MIGNDRPATSEQSLLVSAVRLNLFQSSLCLISFQNSVFLEVAQNLPS